jgi:quercetin dioxygenase-like cupin family protein
MSNGIRFTISSLIVLGVALTASSAWSQKPEAPKPEAPPPDSGKHIMLPPAAVQWGPAPPTLPAGAQVAVIEGKPTDPGPFTMRIKFPAGYKIQPHWHPGDEHVTVISGTFRMGLGEKFDEKALHDLPAGGFAVMNKGTRHFAMTKGATVVQVHGIGPWGINYVNPSDDPRTAKK